MLLRSGTARYFRVWRAKKVDLGHVEATAEVSAIDKPMEEFKIDPARRFRLLAEPVK